MATESPTAHPEASASRRRTMLRQILANRGFVLCALLLAALAISFQVFASARGIQFRKLAVELKAPLNLLDQTRLTRTMFELDPSLHRKLYSGRISLGLREALQAKGLSLSPDTDVSVKKPDRLWQLTEPDHANGEQATYLIRSDSDNGPLAVLAPYSLLNAFEIKPEVLDSLGTEQYIQWLLYDHSNPDSTDPANYIQLFITYYTGTPDQVPHVPEECYMGGGVYQKDQWFMDVPVPALGPDAKVEVKVLEFERPRFMSHGSKIVMYVFHTNGQFCPDRTCVRMTLANPSDKHAYFSKVELTFGTPKVLPTKEQAIASGKRLLQVLLPVLAQDHWPDWEQVKLAESASASTH